MNEYREVVTFLNLIGATEEEALSALLSAFGPPQPGAVAGAWKKNSAYGHSAPSTKEFWDLFTASKFQCVTCGSMLRLTVDHVDGNAKNHKISNLQVLCFRCNRAKLGKKNVEARANVALYRAALALYQETGTIPRNKEVVTRAGIRASGGTYLLKFLRFLSTVKSETSTKIDDDLSYPS